MSASPLARSPTESPTHSLHDWLAGWLGSWAGSLARWLAGSLARWLAGWLAHWRAGLLTSLACWLAGLSHYLVAYLLNIILGYVLATYFAAWCLLTRVCTSSTTDCSSCWCFVSRPCQTAPYHFTIRNTLGANYDMRIWTMSSTHVEHNRIQDLVGSSNIHHQTCETAKQVYPPSSTLGNDKCYRRMLRTVLGEQSFCARGHFLGSPLVSGLRRKQKSRRPLRAVGSKSKHINAASLWWLERSQRNQDLTRFLRIGV